MQYVTMIQAIARDYTKNIPVNAAIGVCPDGRRLYVHRINIETNRSDASYIVRERYRNEWCEPQICYTEVILRRWFKWKHYKYMRAKSNWELVPPHTIDLGDVCQTPFAMGYNRNGVPYTYATLTRLGEGWIIETCPVCGDRHYHGSPSMTAREYLIYKPYRCAFFEHDRSGFILLEKEG